MALSNPPQYRYSLFKKWDKYAFSFIGERGKTKEYPVVIGNSEDKNQFLITLIRTQKSLHDWRDFLKTTLTQIEKDNTVNTALLNEKYRPESISKETPAWVTYKEDKIVNSFMDELETRKVIFVGNDEEMGEFVLRFILGQLGHDWEQTILMIWEMLGDESQLNLSELNNEMKNFDYMNLFK